MKILKKYIDFFGELIYFSSINIIIWIFFTVFISSIFLLFNSHISIYTFVLPIILTLIFNIYVFYKLKKLSIFKSLLSILLSIFAVIFSIYVSGKYYDISWDGNTYHKDAIGCLKNGWNPIYENYIEFYSKNDIIDMNIIGNEISGTHGFWQTYYAKASWIFSSNIYFVTNDIESSKILNILLLYALFGLSLEFFRSFLNNRIFAFVISLLLAINPISIVQVFTYYNDVALMAYLFMVIITFIKLFQNDFRSIWDYIVFLPILMVAINLKFNCFAYCGIFCLSIFMIYCIKCFKSNQLKKIILPIVIIGTSVLISISIIGFSPYITNIVNGKHLFYPLFGKDKVDIITNNQPKDFENYNNLTKFAYSIFSESKNINRISNLSPNLKFPFVVNDYEVSALKVPDLRIGGFGVLFSGIFIIAILVLLHLFILKRIPNITLYYISLSIIFATIFLIIFVNGSWWARYSPFVYLIPIISLILLYFSSFSRKIKKFLISLLTILLFINNFYFIQNNLLINFEKSREIRKILNNYKDSNKSIIVVDKYNSFLGFLYNLNDKNISYFYTNEISENDKHLFRSLMYREGMNQE